MVHPLAFCLALLSVDAQQVALQANPFPQTSKGMYREATKEWNEGVEWAEKEIKKSQEICRERLNR